MSTALVSFIDTHMDTHKKLQTQIRMTPENQARFRSLAKARKISAEALLMAALDALEARNEPSNADLLEMLKARLISDTPPR